MIVRRKTGGAHLGSHQNGGFHQIGFQNVARMELLRIQVHT